MTIDLRGLGMTTGAAVVDVLRERACWTAERCRDDLEDLGRELREHALTGIA